MNPRRPSRSRKGRRVASRLAIFAALVLVLPFAACGTTTTTTSEWGGGYAGAQWARAGQIEWIRETVQRREGNPAGGAVAGAIIGSIIGGRGPGALLGAAGGAAIGAAASQGSSEARWYEVMVRFDDGGYQTFAFGAPPPFWTGERVALTPEGLRPT